MAVVERAKRREEWDPRVFAWRKVVQVTQWRELAGRLRLAVDGMGVGRPALDRLGRARPGSAGMPINITGGLKQAEEGGSFGAPKRDLILGLRVRMVFVRHGLEFGPAT